MTAISAKYLGVKLIEAVFMSEFDFIHETKGEEALLKAKEYRENRLGYKVTYEDGYVSWSPKAVFDKAYRRTDGLTFGLAIEAMKQGKAVARLGWNGKGMHISLNRGNIDPSLFGFKDMEHPKFPHGSTIDGIDMGLFSLGDSGSTTRLPNIDMLTASGSVVRGWLASQTDILAEDWIIVE